MPNTLRCAAFSLLIITPLAACGDLGLESAATETGEPASRTLSMLQALPEPAQSVPLGLTPFFEPTGQLSTAPAYLMDAVRSAGNGTWFSLTSAPQAVLQNAVVGVERQTLTGGEVAEELGIAMDVPYQADRVSIAFHLFDAASGQSAMPGFVSTKTVYSVAVDSGIRYRTTDAHFQPETGMTAEPLQLASRHAVEAGVYALVMQGAAQNIWAFADAEAGNAALQNYFAAQSRPAAPAVAAAPTPLSEQELASQPTQIKREEPATPPSMIEVQPPQPEAIPLAAEIPATPAPVETAQTQPAATPQEPFPNAVYQRSAAPRPVQPITRLREPRALVKYLDESRYANRHANND